MNITTAKLNKCKDINNRIVRSLYSISLSMFKAFIMCHYDPVNTFLLHFLVQHWFTIT